MVLKIENIYVPENDDAYVKTYTYVESALSSLLKQINTGKLEVFNIINNIDNLADIKSFTNKIAEKYNSLTVIGTGGSTLNPKIFTNLGNTKTALPVYYIDYVDPSAYSNFLNNTDIHNMFFLVTSKSGTTLETLAITLAMIKHLQDSGIKNIADRFAFITENYKSPLAAIAEQLGAEILPHNNIGGRYAGLTNVGLIPASYAGLDINKIITGANNFLQNLDIYKEAICQTLTSIMMISDNYKINNYVLMPYFANLYDFSLWFRQLWAESLGKNGKGIVLVPALGTIDQHSQLQLYLDGPKDKFFTFITGNNSGKGAGFYSDFITASLQKELSYLTGKTLGDIEFAELKATIEVFKEKQIASRNIIVEEIDAQTIGALYILFVFETLLAAQVINVNPFDQPAVEQGKNLALDYLLNNIS